MSNQDNRNAHTMTRRLLALFAFLLPLKALAITLVVGLEQANNSPFEYINEGAQLTGFHVELVQAVTARLGWQVEFRRHPWKRVMRGLEDGELNAATFVARSSNRDGFALFLPDNLLHVSRTTLYIRQDRADEIHYSPPLEQWLQQWRTGIPNGYYMNDEVAYLIERGVPISQPTVTQSQLFIMLMSNRFDAIFGSTSALARGQTEIANLADKVQPLDGARFTGTKMYIAFSREAPPEWAMAFAEAYRQFRDEPGYQALVQKFGIDELDLQPSVFDFQ